MPSANIESGGEAQTGRPELAPPHQVPAAWTPGYVIGREDTALDLRRLLGIVRRNAWVLLACLAVSLVIGILLTRRAVPRYESTATLRITAEEAGMPGLGVLGELSGAGNEVNTELEVLRSRTLAGEVVDRHQLRVRVVSPRKVPRGELFSELRVQATAPAGTLKLAAEGDSYRVTARGAASKVVRPGEAIEVEGVTFALRPEATRHRSITLEVLSRELAITELAGDIRVSRPSRDANILAVRYLGDDPELVEAVPNSLVEAFVSQRVGTRRTGARSTVGFLRGQIDTLQVELQSAEQAMKQFREREQVVSLPDQASAGVGKLAELQATRDQVAAELTAVEATLASAKASAGSDGGGSPFRRLLAFPTLLRNPLIPSLIESITELENQRTMLRVRRTERDPEVVALSRQIAGVEAQIANVVGTYSEGLRQQVVALDQALAAGADQLRLIPAKEMRFAQLARSAQVLGELSTLLQSRLKEAEIAQAVEDPSAQVVDFAERPTEPVSPRPGLNLVLATLVGLLVGGTLTAGRELLDNKIHSREALQEVANGLPVLGVIPRFDAATLRQVRATQPLRGRNDKNTALVARESPQATVLEAYRALRTSLAFATAGRPPKVILVTSATPDEGKSTSAANLAASLAQQKQRVLLIDADMRRGSMHRTLGGTRTPGLSEILTGRGEPLEAIQSLEFEGLGRIDFLATGTLPPNPAELLSSNRLVDLIDQVVPLYDMILIDAPPVNVVTDVLLVSRHVDGVLLVARGGKTERGALRFALEQLTTVRAPVLGTLLNDYDPKRASSYGDYARYRYDTTDLAS